MCGQIFLNVARLKQIRILAEPTVLVNFALAEPSLGVLINRDQGRSYAFYIIGPVQRIIIFYLQAFADAVG